MQSLVEETNKSKKQLQMVQYEFKMLLKSLKNITLIQQQIENQI